MTAEPTSCPPEEAVIAYGGGTVAAGARPALEEHIDGCARCRALLVRVVTRTVAPAPAEETLPLDDRVGALPGPRNPGTPGQGPGVQLARGQRLGRYLIVEDVGAGGMGTVYAAYDTLLDRKVALKVLTGRHAQAPARVLAEAAAMARLQHPNVVTVHDVGVVGGLTYLSMELVEGVNLAQWRRAQPRSYRQIAQVMAAAARGLAAAHAAGIIHRDVKPHNILVAGTRVLVTDFGVSIRTGLDADGSIAGTPAYMAPEQFRGERVDARSDVFGFCATLYEILHGEPPFPGTSREEVRALVASGRVQPPPARSRAPARLHRLALRGLDPDPARRPADMAAVADELLVDPSARRRNLVLAAAAAATVVGAFWGGGYLKGQPERQCLAGAAVMDGTWNDGRRGELRQRYAAAGALASWTVLERAFDAYAGGWRAAHAETCSATYGKRVQSDEVFDLRMVCLADQRATVDTFISALGTATPRQLVQAAGAGLPALAECQITGRSETKPRPTDAASRARLAEIEQRIAESLAQQALGDYARAATSAAAAVAGARKLGYQPTLAAALIRAAVVAKQGRGADTGGSGLEQATKQLEEAYAVAELGRDDRQRLAAAREQVSTQLYRGNLQEAELWARMGEALLSRLGNPPSDASRLSMYVGWLRHFQGRRSEARAAFQRALDLGGKVDPPDRRQLAEAQGSLCGMIDDPGQEIACFRKALAMGIAAFGPRHPALSTFYGNLATPLADRRSTHAESCAMSRQQMEAQRTLDPAYQNVIIAMVNLAACLVADARNTTPAAVAEARRLLDDAFARKLAPVDRAFVHKAYGIVMFDHVDPEAGLQHLKAALADYQGSYGPASDDAFDIHERRADMLVSLGRTAEALAEIDAALQAARKEKVATLREAQLRARRAGLLVAAGRADAGLTEGQQAMRDILAREGGEVNLGMVLHAIGTAQLALGRVREAVVTLERGVAARRPAGELIVPEVLANLQVALARAIAREGGSDASARRRACALADEAAAFYGGSLGRRAVHREARRWLTAQRCPGSSTAP